MRQRWLIALLMAGATSLAVAGDWRGSWDGTLYGYSGADALNGASVLNPGNRIANLAQHSDTAEARFDLKAATASWRFTALPILQVRTTDTSGRGNAAYLSRWRLGWRVAPAWSVSAGRELLNWGAAQFRSPSSPFYFDNGRTDPMRVLSGMDTAVLSWTPDPHRSLTLARIADSGHAAAVPDPWRDGWLARWAQRGEDWSGGLALAQAAGRAPFVGLNLQRTLDDAWLLYAEASSGTRSNALASPANAAQPFALQAESPRRSDWLLGASYTLDDGQSLYAEFLHDGHGYTAAQEQAWFARAAAAPSAAGMALGYAPSLLGRDYLHLVWQSNLMDSTGYWRAMATHSFTDGGNQLSGYAEYLLHGQVSLFVLGAFSPGGARREFSALLRRSLTVGVKLALP